MTLQSRNLVLQRDQGNSYLRHLRAVQRISSKDVLSPNKQRKRYNSIIDMHHTHKEQNRSFILRESREELKQRNEKILIKLLDISRKKPKFDVCENSAFVHSLNAPFRLREQMHIEHQNAKLLKGILCQRSSVSTILPKLNRRGNKSSMGNPQNEEQKNPPSNSNAVG